MVGSVTDLLVMSPGKVLCSTSNGDVSIISIHPQTNSMSTDQLWKKLHRFDSTNEAACCSCTATYGHDIATGENEMFIVF